MMSHLQGPRLGISSSHPALQRGTETVNLIQESISVPRFRPRGL